jgi:hypothetical protein
MRGFQSYVYLHVETIRRTAQIDSEKGEAMRTGGLEGQVVLPPRHAQTCSGGTASS